MIFFPLHRSQTLKTLCDYCILESCDVLYIRCVLVLANNIIITYLSYNLVLSVFLELGFGFVLEWVNQITRALTCGGFIMLTICLCKLTEQQLALFLLSGRSCPHQAWCSSASETHDTMYVFYLKLHIYHVCSSHQDKFMFHNIMDWLKHQSLLKWANGIPFCWRGRVPYYCISHYDVGLSKIVVVICMFVLPVNCCQLLIGYG